MATAPALRSSSSTPGVGVSSVAATKPTGAVPNDILFAYVISNSGTAPSVVPSGWTTITGVANGTAIRVDLYVRRCNNSESASWTWSWATTHNVLVVVEAWTGLSGVISTFNFSTTTTASGTTQNAPAMTITDKYGMAAFGFWANADGSSTYSSPPSGFAISTQAQGTGISMAVAERQYGSMSAGTGTLSITTSGTAVGCGISWAWRPQFFDAQNNDLVPMTSAPSISSSTSASLATTGNMIIDVTLPEGGVTYLRRVVIDAYFPTHGITETVYDSAGFGAEYPGGVRSAITNGYEYTFTRAPSGQVPGWIETPTFRVIAIDVWGQERTQSYTPTVSSPATSTTTISSSTSSSLASATTPMVIDVTNNQGASALALVIIYVDYPTPGIKEVVYGLSGFGEAYSSNATRVSITNGYRYTFYRDSGGGHVPGWPDSAPTFKVVAVDTWGGETTASYAPAVTGAVQFPGYVFTGSAVSPGEGTAMPKGQFQSTEDMLVSFPPFTDKTTGLYIVGTDTCTVTIKKPDNTVTSQSATWDTDVNMWLLTISHTSYQQGAWKFKAVSNNANALNQYKIEYWGDYVEDITTAKTQATIAAQAPQAMYERIRDVGQTKKSTVRKVTVKLVATATGNPITGVAFGSVTVYYLKEGQATATLKVLSSGDWSERDATNEAGYYDLQFSGTELDTVGQFFFSVSSAGSYVHHGRMDVVANITSDVVSLLGTPAGASVSADIAGVRGASNKDLTQLDTKLGTPAAASVSADIAGVRGASNKDLTQIDSKLGTPSGASMSADIASAASAASSAGTQATAAAADTALLKKERFNHWKIVGTQLILYDDNGTTVLKVWDLKDDAGLPSSTRVFERIPL